MNIGQGMVTAREGFGTKELAHSAETQTSALMAAAKAAVEARFTMALMRPRNVDDARVRLLRACARPAFAASASWRKPQGGKTIEGPSIRLAEEAARCYGNIHYASTTIVDDQTKRITRVEATDLEVNLTVGTEITTSKIVERRDPKDRLVLGERTNSAGERVFLLEATEDELLNKISAQTSKALRVMLLRLVPSDLVDEARGACARLLAEGVRRDPGAAKKALVDSFAAIGIMPRALEAYIGHDLSALQPAELEDLRGIYAAVRDGEATWSDFVNQRGTESESQATEAGTKKSAPAALADQIRSRKKAKAEAAPAPESKPVAEPEAPKPDEATAPTEPAPEAAPPPLTDEEKAALIDAGNG